MRSMMTAVSMLAVLGATPGPAGAAEAPARFEASFGDFVSRIRAVPGAPPGLVAVVVHGGDTVFERAYGERDRSTGRPMTLDTPVYNASVTKAYTGLLAAMVDADGTLPLAASLRDVWPNLTLPNGLDAGAVTGRRLLSHSAGVRAGGLVFRSVTTGDIRMRDVADHLGRYATRGRDGFGYDNFGPFVWSAMLEARTGVPWRTQLERKLLAPLGLRHSAARLEDLPVGQVARCHIRKGGAWTATPPKPTVLLNAAGGMFTSGRDAATFIKAFVTEGRSAGGRIPAAALARTWQKESEQSRALWGMQRDGYGLGWDLGSVGGRRFVSRSGGYPGCRAISMFLPELDLGVVLMSNGDIAANDLHAAIFAQAIDDWTAAPEAATRGAERIADYAKTAARAVAEADAGDPRLAKVTAIETARWLSAAGVYENRRLGRLEVGLDRDGLWMASGAFRARLLSIGADDFLLESATTGEVESLKFERDAGGKLTGLLWDDDRYARMADRRR